MRLRRVGFYRELPYGAPRDPSLREALGAAPQPHAREIAGYLLGAPRIAVAPLVSHDVLDPGLALGTPSLHTDGAWAWPSDLAHYVATHHLQLPPEFIGHMERQQWRPPRDLTGDDWTVEGLVEMSDTVNDGGDDA